MRLELLVVERTTDEEVGIRRAGFFCGFAASRLPLARALGIQCICLQGNQQFALVERPFSPTMDEAKKNTNCVFVGLGKKQHQGR